MRKFLGRLVRVVGALLVIALIGGGAWLYKYASDFADRNMHPPRYNNPATPPDYGIVGYQEVAFVTSDGLTIRGWYIPGTNGATIILGHTHGGSRVVMLPYAAILARSGYGLMMFDYRGEGASDGDTITFGQYEMLDTVATINYLIAEKGIDQERIGAMGESLGGTVVTRIAAGDPRIKAVISISTFTSIQDVATYQTYGIPLVGALVVGIGQAKAGIDAKQVSPIGEVCRISPRPILLIYGEHENFLPPDTASRMYAAACDPKELWVVPGAGHGGFLDAAPQEFPARIVAFFDQNLLGRNP